MMQRVSARILTAAAMASLLSLAVPGAALAQMGASPATGAKMELAGVPVAARQAFMGGIDDLVNIFFARGLSRLEEAIKLAPDFGLARVFWARQAPGMSMDTRTAELNRGVADAAKGAAGEAALAMALRAQRLGQTSDAQVFFRTARQLLPGDPYVAYFAVNGSFGPNTTPQDRIVALRRLTVQFPSAAPAYNTLAYALYGGGDHTGGLEAVRKYGELAPNHPNAKDSYGEMLQWEGRFDDAVALYREAAAIDPTYAAAYTGIADARQLQGRGMEARAALTEGLAVAPNANAKANLHLLIALSYAADGDRKGAEQAMGSAMSEAPATATGLINNIHRDFALVSVMTGNRNGVAPHLQAAATSQGMAWISVNEAMMLAAAGMNAEARAKHDQASRAPLAGDSTFVRQNLPIVRALLLVNEGNGEAAITEVAKGDITSPLAKAVTALAEQQRKNVVTARLLRDQIRSDPQSAIGNRQLALARTLVARVK
jgi:tetratricopeptide (TPR) repeat protein